MDVDSITCPKCGYVNNFLSEECVKCGITFSIYPGESDKNRRNGEIGDDPIDEGTSPEGLITCPQCGHINTDTEECKKCGVIFAKYFKIQGREKSTKSETEDLARAEEGSQDVLTDAEEKGAREKAEAERHEKEAQAKVAVQRKEEDRKKAEIRQKEREAREKAEAERHEKEAQAKVAVQRKEEERKKAEARQKEREAREKAEADRREKEAQEKAVALWKEEERKKTEALHREKAAKGKAADLTFSGQERSIEAVFKKYEGQNIGINYDDSKKIKEAKLVSVHDDYFSVFVMDNELVYNFPFRNILSIVEGPQGVGIRMKRGDPVFPAVIRVFHLAR